MIEADMYIVPVLKQGLKSLRCFLRKIGPWHLPVLSVNLVRALRWSVVQW